MKYKYNFINSSLMAKRFNLFTPAVTTYFLFSYYSIKNHYNFNVTHLLPLYYCPFLQHSTKHQ